MLFGILLFINLLWKLLKLFFFSSSSCIRVCALGIYVYEELSHGTMHSKIHDAIEAILDSVKVSLSLMPFILCLFDQLIYKSDTRSLTHSCAYSHLLVLDVPIFCYI